MEYVFLLLLLYIPIDYLIETKLLGMYNVKIFSQKRIFQLAVIECIYSFIYLNFINLG